MASRSDFSTALANPASRCRLCTANDREALVAELATKMWDSRRGGTLDDVPLEQAGARAESVKTAASFKGPFARRRCLVPADGWYEWKGEGKPKPMFYFEARDAAPICFAGIWDSCETTDQGRVETFAIVTRSAWRAAERVARPCAGGAVPGRVFDVAGPRRRRRSPSWRGERRSVCRSPYRAVS